MNLFSLRRFIADFDAPAASGHVDKQLPASNKPSVHLVTTVGAGCAFGGEVSTTLQGQTLIWPRPSLAAARQAALDLARRWGQSKRRQSGILFVEDHPSHLRANDQAALHAAIDSNTAAVVLGAGCTALTAEYCQAAAQLCRDLHILLIIDGDADHPPFVNEGIWGIHADIVIVDHDPSHGFLQPAFVVRTHTDGLGALARLRGQSPLPQGHDTAGASMALGKLHRPLRGRPLLPQG